jgi:hypothetical protein
MLGSRNGKEKKLFPADQFATEIASCIERDLSKVPLFDRTFGSDILYQLRSRQISDTLKRYQKFDGYDRDALESNCFDNFKIINDRMGVFNDLLSNPIYWDYPLAFGATNTLSRVRTIAQFLLKQVLGPFWWDELHLHVKHGSGSTIGASYEDTSVDKKFTYPLSCTRDVESLFECHIRSNTTLERAVTKLNSNVAYGDKYDIVEASRGTTVDKTSSKRRMIAVEPTLNMFFQQGLMTMMYARLKDVGLDLESLPQRHRDLARSGSVTRKWGTIDFSAASDSVSFELIRQLMPPDWFYALNLVRTPFMELDGEIHRLNMFSTMGNATTFPLETLLFWAIGCACHHIKTRKLGNLVEPKTKRLVSVFGDDCVLPTDSCDFFIETIKLFGFKVNEEKSFIDPNHAFRESCGGDYYQGIDVRPYAFKAPHSQRLSALEPWLYTILNNILPIYTRYFGYYESVLTMELGSYIFNLFREYKLKFKLVPHDFPDDGGLRCCLTSHDVRPRLDRTVSLLQTMGVSLSPILRGELGNYEFAYVKFSYPKDKKRFEDIKYAMWLYSTHDNDPEQDPVTRERKCLSHPHILLRWLDSVRFLGLPDRRQEFKFLRSRTPVRKKGGYVVSRTIGSFY